MGFMGFGMQKWIYTMRPRKPFSMKRKGSFSRIPTYNRYFQLQSSKDTTNYNFEIILLTIFAIILTSTLPKWHDYAIERHKQEIAYAKAQDDKAFNFLIKSGKYRLSKGSLAGAYSEFKLAEDIRPNDAELNALLFETLSRLCINYKKHCYKLDNF